jgi:hypothetical protein
MFSGAISLIIINWALVVMGIMIDGELFNCNASVMFTLLKYHDSHHGRSVTCHVSAIQKDTCPSHYTWPDQQCGNAPPMAEDVGFSW